MTAGVLALLVLAAAAATGPEAAAPRVPLTLEQCRALTVEGNAEVKAADLGVSAAEETKKAAFTKYFPQVSAMAAGVQSGSPLAEVTTQGGNLPVFNGTAPTGLTAHLPAGTLAMAEHGYLASISAVQPLYAGGRIVNGNRLASLSVEAARESAGMARRDALALTEEKYWRVVELREKERTLAAYEGLLRALEAQASDALTAGIATRNDLLKVSVKRQQAAVDRMRLESGLRLAARDLRRHVGLSEGDEIVPADALAPPEDPAVLRDRSEAGPDRRPELRQLQRGVRAEELQGALEKGERLPSVSVGAMALRHDFSGLNRYQDVLVYGTVTVPISAFWEKHHTVAAQEARAEVARTRLADTRKLVAIEIEKAWADLQAAYRAAQVAEAAIEQAEVNLREERDRYDNGFVTLSDLLEAEVLHQAQDQRIEARRAYWLSRSAYLRATGEPS